MPAGFEWCSLDVNDPAQLLEVYNLLNENYVEDDDCMFRFDSSDCCSTIDGHALTVEPLMICLRADSTTRCPSCSGRSPRPGL